MSGFGNELPWKRVMLRRGRGLRPPQWLSSVRWRRHFPWSRAGIQPLSSSSSGTYLSGWAVVEDQPPIQWAGPSARTTLKVPAEVRAVERIVREVRRVEVAVPARPSPQMATEPAAPPGVGRPRRRRRRPWRWQRRAVSRSPRRSLHVPRCRQRPPPRVGRRRHLCLSLHPARLSACPRHRVPWTGPCAGGGPRRSRRPVRAPLRPHGLRWLAWMSSDPLPRARHNHPLRPLRPRSPRRPRRLHHRRRPHNAHRLPRHLLHPLLLLRPPLRRRRRQHRDRRGPRRPLARRAHRHRPRRRRLSEGHHRGLPKRSPRPRGFLMRLRRPLHPRRRRVLRLRPATLKRCRRLFLRPPARPPQRPRRVHPFRPLRHPAPSLGPQHRRSGRRGGGLKRRWDGARVLGPL